MTLTTRTEMRRCGKPYASEAEAMDSKRGRGGGFRAEQCPLCPDWHLRRIPVGTRTVKPSAADTGPDRATRALVLARDGFACVCCGQSIIGQRYSLQHRKRRSQGGRNDPPNLITVLGHGTQGCHARIDSRIDPHDEAKGYTVRSHDDPAAIPVMYFEESGSGVLMYLDDEGNLSPDAPAGAA